MNRLRILLLLVAVAAGCKGSKTKFGALFHGPGALALFDGYVATQSGTFRKYLAVAAERGDELRLVDTTDNHVVESPGLVFPLSIPTSGMPMFVAAADLNDGAHPDVLAVIAAGSRVVEVVNTWDSFPRTMPALQVDLGAYAPGAEVLSMVGVRVPTAAATDGSTAPDVGRILVGLSGGRLALIDFKRDPADLSGNAIGAPTVTVLTGLGFDPGSISQGADARLVYCSAIDPLPSGRSGIAELTLKNAPAGPTDWSRRDLGALAPTIAVAAIHLTTWDYVSNAFGTPVDRVVAVPDPSECGASKDLKRCGLLLVDPAGTPAKNNLVPNLSALAGEEQYLLPIPIPGPVTGILAAGRETADIPITTAAGTTSTSGVAVVTAADGRVYLVDVARWALADDVSPVTGAGRTRASDATAIAGTGSKIGLWGLDLTTPPSTLAADVAARVRVTPGFTPDDTWTLAYQGVLPSLDSRTAFLGWNGTTLSLTVQATATSPWAVLWAVPPSPSLGVAVADTVAIAQTGNPCLDGAERPVEALLPGGAVQIAPPACLVGAPAFSQPVSGVATVRGGGLVLSGAKHGLAARPTAIAASPSASDEARVSGARLFYVTDPCTAGSECATNWTGPPFNLTFPLPTGPALGLVAAWVDATGNATTTPPSRDTAIAFKTWSGLVPSARRPIDGGKVLSSALPSGLAVLDGGAGASVTGWTSFTSGLVMRFDTGAAPGSMTVIR